MKEGWERQRLEDCFKLKSGDGLTSKMMSEDGQYPVFGGNGIAGLHNEFNLFGSNVIIGRVGALCGNVRHMTEKIWLTDNAFKITDFKLDFDNAFLTYLLNFKNLREYARQAAQPVISNSSLKDVILEFPKSLNEQQRIVAILDEAFAAISKAKANAEQNLRNAKELFESYLQRVFEKKGDGWEEKALKDLTTKIGSGATPRGGQENYKSEGISLVRSMNVHDWEFRVKNLALIDEKQAKELDGVTLQEDDVLLNITGASVARCCVFPKEYLPARVNQHVSIIRPKEELLDSRFLNFLLTSKPYKDQLLFTGEQGATRQAITKAQIETFKISIPKLEIQKDIVNKLDSITTETKKLEAIYQQKINDLEELRKSILQKAFSGELSESGYAGFKDKQDLLGDKNSSKSSNHYNGDSDSLNYEQD